MSKPKHTPEPWVIHDRFGICSKALDKVIVLAADGFPDSHKVNCERIVACVNACAGINPEAVPEMLEALSEATHAMGYKLTRDWGPIIDKCKAALAKAEGREL